MLISDSSFATAMLKVIYGIDTAATGDQYVAVVEEAIEGPAQGMLPGRFLVEYLPILRYIPPWFPGASSQRLFQKWQDAGARLKNMPYNDAKAALVSASNHL